MLFNPLLYHIAIVSNKYSIPISGSHNLQCLRTFYFLAQLGDSVTESNCVAVSVTLLALHVHASVRAPSCPISSPLLRLLNINKTKTRCTKLHREIRFLERPLKHACQYGGHSVPNCTCNESKRHECVIILSTIQTYSLSYFL